MYVCMYVCMISYMHDFMYICMPLGFYSVIVVSGPVVLH